MKITYYAHNYTWPLTLSGGHPFMWVLCDH
jgi:hypothetical protein